MFKLMTQRRQYLLEEISMCLQRIERLPEGKLEVYKNRDGVKLFVKKPFEERKYLPKEFEGQAPPLAERMYYEAYLNELKKELYAVERYLNHCVKENDSQKFLIESSKLYPYLKDSIKLRKKEEQEWAQALFQSNPEFPDKLIHPSPSGHMLRSKTEARIDEALFRRGIPFRYECLLEIGGYCFYPDFTFYKIRTKEHRYLEHNGRMDEPNYVKKFLAKNEVYIKNGMIPDINLYYTFENSEDPLTYHQINHVVDEIERWLES